MADRPILFSALMVRALLAGTKTQTRRLVTFPGIENVVEFVRVGFDKNTGVAFYEMKDGGGKHLYRPAGKHMQTPHWSPRYAVGDELWVREAFCDPEGDCRPVYRANLTPQQDAESKRVNTICRGLKGIAQPWKPGIHMPRWASRLTLTVTEVRVQRLQEISEADAIAEGVGAYVTPADNPPVVKYQTLWDGLNADRAPWSSNPWVVAVSFTVERRNIDEVAP